MASTCRGSGSYWTTSEHGDAAVASGACCERNTAIFSISPLPSSYPGWCSSYQGASRPAKEALL
jgi:hypothetical protein